MRRREFLAAGAALAAAGCTTPGLKLDVPYVSTPIEVVDAMLALARVGPQDTVYDLGCGDGRFVVTAAKDYGARGVGIDLDPRRIEEANAAAAREGVTGRVRFLRQDLFAADLRPATVVTLFLIPEVNAKLAPKLRAELRRGARVVSYRYGIEGWPPDEGAHVEINHETHHMMLWRIA